MSGDSGQLKKDDFVRIMLSSKLFIPTFDKNGDGIVTEVREIGIVTEVREIEIVTEVREIEIVTEVREIGIVTEVREIWIVTEVKKYGL